MIRNAVHFRCIASVLMVVAVWVMACCPANAQQNAKQIVQESGITGGLIVHLGCADGELTAGLRISGAFLVHGLDKDAANVRKARAAVAAKDLYGVISIERLRGSALPYADNLVNLLIVEDQAAISSDELMRVVTPGGVILSKQNGAWKKTVKAWPKDIDEWTHFLHGPDGNAVGSDKRVGPPKHIQWMGSPKFSRAHEQQASFSSAVTAGGRIYYVMDEGPRVDIRLPAQWVLVARDAFSGIVLWKKPMGKWIDQFRRFRAGPASLQFRLVVDRDKVFATLDFEGPVSVLDAASGKTIRVIKDSEYTKQIIYRDGVLTLLVDEQVGKLESIDAARRKGQFIPHNCRILKVNAETGEQLWKRQIDELVFPCMVYKQGRLFGQTTKRVFALDDNTGDEKWSADVAVQLPVSAGKLKTGEMQWESPTLLVGDKAVYAADFKKVHAYGVEDGKLIWQGPSAKGYNAPADMHLINGKLWMQQKGQRVALDSMTGQVKKQYPQHRGYMHARCYRNKVSGKFMMMGLMGVQMLDLENGEVYDNDWIRGTCQYGVLPANGLLYVPPDSCACNMKTKLSGIYALAASRNRPAPAKDSDPLLEKGPVYGKKLVAAEARDDWATFRGSAGRTGLTSATVNAQLSQRWSAKIGGKLSSISVAGGKVYVAAVDRHTLYALDRNSGKIVWQYMAGGRIDSPPTIDNGAVFFGSADGWIYCVSADDGSLIWRLRAAPEERRVMIRGQLESAWPVHGSILLHDGKLKVAAGRSSYLDGGIRLLQIDPKTGSVLSRTTIFSPDKVTGRQPAGGGRDVRGALSDIMVASGPDIYMRHVKLDFKTGSEQGTGVHLFSPIGLLDDTWWHRAYWIYNDQFTSHWSGWWKVGNKVPSGRILSYDDKAIFGFGRDKYPGGNTGQWRGGEKYHLFALDRSSLPKPATPAPKVDRRGKKTKKPRGPVQSLKYRWTKQVPLLATSLVVAGDKVLIAGPPDVVKVTGLNDQALELTNPQVAVDAWAGRKGGILYAASANDGAEVGQFKLSAPTVFDGMAAAGGGLFLALQDGTVICMSSKN